MTHEPDALPPISGGQLRSARRLLQAKARRESGRFLVEGAQAVREALRRPGLVVSILTDDPADDADLLALAPAGSVARLTPEQSAQLSETVRSQGVFAICRELSASLAEIQQPRLVVICAQVRDPGNAGTVIRCADAFGADVVILTEGSVELENPKTVRASVGSIFHLPVVTGITTADAVAWCRTRGLQVWAAAGDGQLLSDPAIQARLAEPTAWLFGNEAWGLPDADRALADRVVGIPIYGEAESLNLSTAAAVCLFASATAAHRSRPVERPLSTS